MIGCDTMFGTMVRTYRAQKGYTLSEFAAKLGVSVGYLSNLENGKNVTIKLSILEKLQDELHIDPFHSKQTEDSMFERRIERASKLLRECQQINPSYTEHFLSQFEQSLDLLREG
ncbi:helix-turn-helix domain-containing protein [Litchfieldia alkalitelluris]|uniref:helix-turn-helix domain-containing protein n=1 Tax=Litchfieldia alkalitelluris TaxID=304268 RepID=UPI000996FB4E|nr:helix-turn-helix transcriptional regulator [Litchfieldia alkalitelluris]